MRIYFLSSGLAQELIARYNPIMSTATSRDTIPRLHRVVAHTRDQLRGIANGDTTFEDCRIRYGNTQRRLAQEGRGRSTSPPAGISEVDRNWSPTRDCISELMRWGAVVDKPLPSARRFVDRYRKESYELTEYGDDLAQLASDDARFVDEISQRLIAVHPYLRRLLLTLQKHPIRCPTVSEGDIERSRLGTRGWAQWASERIEGETSAAAIEQEITAHLGKRFGNPPAGNPTNKAIVETTNDALMVAAFAAQNIRFDALTIRALLRWGSELLLYDQSRYIPEFRDANVIWLASDLSYGDSGELIPSRRGIAEYGDRVAHAFPKAYDDQARTSNSSLGEPYLPIHQLRAQVAHECAVTRTLCDLVLSRLVDGEYPKVDVEVLLHIGTTGLPISEPAFRHHGRRRLEITIRNKHRDTQ